MKVYRLCKEAEINYILKNKDFKNIGNFFNNDKKKNNHSYRAGKKYLHFFKDLKSILYLNSTKGHFICTYNIPDNILNQRNGFGQYLDYINFKTLHLVSEYAVENDLIQFGFLTKIDKIIQDLDYEDLYYNPDFKGLIESIYENENPNELDGENE